ncbi:MAG: phosphomannomutase [Pseudomonadota bacterium]
MTPLTCFKAYDVRGRLGVDLDEGVAYRIGRAFAEVMGAASVVLGRDCRASSQSLSDAVAQGLLAGGADVLNLGLSGTEEMYFATTHLGAGGGICVTASHNPMDYNGMKMVGPGSAPLHPETGLGAIRDLAQSQRFAAPNRSAGQHDASAVRSAYVQRVLSFVDVAALSPMTVLVNAGNGAAGPTFDAIAAELALHNAPVRFVRMHHDPDGTFPNGIPNPLLPENQPVTSDAVLRAGADLGVAWDGDFDRCFLFDHTGAFVPGEYVVGLLAEVFLSREPGARIVHDPRVIWNTRDIVAKGGGVPVQARVGHAFIKQVMRDTDAVYGGEMSAHHYFRDFMACDSGMIPWLMILDLLSRRGRSLADVLAERKSAFPSSGEINFRVRDTQAAIARIEQHYAPLASERDDMDGLGLCFDGWRLNLRASNTEPLLRLNVESRGDPDTVKSRVAEISALVN